MTNTLTNLEFSVVTYNIDRREFNCEERLNSFLKYIKKTPPDVILVQEGSRLTYEKMMREMGHMGYKRYLPEISSKRNHCEVIFSKHPIGQMKYHLFRRATDYRGLTIFKLGLWKEKHYGNVWICTANLDFSPAFKRDQIDMIHHMLKYIPTSDTIIFGGDVGIFKYQKDFKPPIGWYDGWYEAGSEKEKYTYNSDENLLASPPYKDRLDRVWFRPGNKPGVECLESKLYGNDSETVISSHYGVWTKFRMKKMEGKDLPLRIQKKLKIQNDKIKQNEKEKKTISLS